MHLFSSFSRAVTLLIVAGMGSARVAAAGDGASPPMGVVEADLVFPRNQTYAPMRYLPIVFAVQNPVAAAALDLQITYEVWNLPNMSYYAASGAFHLSWANFSGADPVLQHSYSRDGFDTEGNWRLVWHVSWVNCTEGQREDQGDFRLGFHHANQGIDFTTSNSAPELDLIAATDNKDCPQDLGVTIDVTGTLKVPPLIHPNFKGGETCAVY